MVRGWRNFCGVRGVRTGAGTNSPSSIGSRADFDVDAEPPRALFGEAQREYLRSMKVRRVRRSRNVGITLR